MSFTRLQKLIIVTVYTAVFVMDGIPAWEVIRP